jgi:hypothetical protein
MIQVFKELTNRSAQNGASAATKFLPSSFYAGSGTNSVQMNIFDRAAKNKKKTF